MTYPNVGKDCAEAKATCDKLSGTPTSGAKGRCYDQELGIGHKCENIGFTAAMCPNQHTYPIKLLHSMIDQVGALFLFLFLIIATPVDEIAYACLHGIKFGKVDVLDGNGDPTFEKNEDGEDVKVTQPWINPGEYTDAYHTLKFTHMCDDVFFYKVSYILNLFCYAVIILCTYLLFIVAPTADNLLLNVMALQFLLDVDNICYCAVMDDATKDKLVQKMLLCYIQNGEKSHDDAHVHTDTCCAKIKWVTWQILRVIGYISFVLWRFLPWLFAAATTVCL